jgi:hypothetical protein
MDDGSMEFMPTVVTTYKFNTRYLDDKLRVSWATACTYLAKAMIVIANRYSGETGARRLREQGYPPEMIEMMKGSGVRSMKFRAGMPVLGVIGQGTHGCVEKKSNGGKKIVDFLLWPHRKNLSEAPCRQSPPHNIFAVPPDIPEDVQAMGS